MNPFVLAAVVVTVIAFLLELLCIALPFWLKYFDNLNNIHYYVGLFDLCPSLNNDYHACVGYDSRYLFYFLAYFVEFNKFEPRHEKTSIMPCANKTEADQPLISVFEIRFQDSTIPIAVISKIPRLQLLSIAKQAALSLTLSQTPKDRFSRDVAHLFYSILFYSSRHPRVTVRHHEACRVMPNSYPSDGIFNLHRRTVMDYFSCTLFLRHLHLDLKRVVLSVLRSNNYILRSRKIWYGFSLIRWRRNVWRKLTWKWRQDVKNDVKTSKFSNWRHARESSYTPHVRRHFLPPVWLTEIPVGFARKVFHDFHQCFLILSYILSTLIRPVG